MSGNICPICGKAVMPYGRFLREAEPYKISACGSCGSKLRRSPRVYALILVMVIVLALGIIPLFSVFEKSEAAFWLRVVIGVVIIAGWALLVNYLGWLLVGWVPAEEAKKTERKNEDQSV